MASVEQQNLLIEHLNRLNLWLTGDQQDRQDEMRGVYARIDQLRADLNRAYHRMLAQSFQYTFSYSNVTLAGPQPVGYPRVPGPHMPVPPPGSVQQPPSTIQDQPIPMPVNF